MVEVSPYTEEISSVLLSTFFLKSEGTNQVFNQKVLRAEFLVEYE